MKKIITIIIEDNEPTEKTVEKFNTFLENRDDYSGLITSKEGTFKLYGGKNESSKCREN